MGYNIAICETEAKNAPCRELKLEIVKAKVGKDDFVDLQMFDEKVSLEDAAKAVGDMDAFMKRNRINPESDCIYMEKVKKEDDRALLAPLAAKVPNGWVRLDVLDGKTAEDVLEKSSKNDRVTGWDEASFEDVNAMCSSCPLAWNKGRNCIETFGPANTKLPEIAEKYKCQIIASVPESAENIRKFSSDDAKEVLREVDVLRPALEKEGKMAVHRYTGPLDRLESMAKACSAENCGFYFF